MERQGIAYLSEHHTTNEFRKLNLSKKSGENVWAKAIEIFRERIYGRYINPIKSLNRNPYENGFVSMAVCCLLIDTLYQFTHGDSSTGNNQMKYVNFLRENMSDIFDSYDKAIWFYRHIRCGILHSAQTVAGSRLTIDGTEAVELSSTGKQVKVDVIIMADRLEDEVNKYITELNNPKSNYRANFIKKMNYITDTNGFE